MLIDAGPFTTTGSACAETQRMSTRKRGRAKEESSEEESSEGGSPNIYVIALDNKLDYKRVNSNGMEASSYTKLPGVLPHGCP